MSRSYIRVTSYSSKRSQYWFFDDSREEEVIRAISEAQEACHGPRDIRAIARLPPCAYTHNIQIALRGFRLILEQCPPGEHVIVKEMCCRCGASQPKPRGPRQTQESRLSGIPPEDAEREEEQCQSAC